MRCETNHAQPDWNESCCEETNALPTHGSTTYTTCTAARAADSRKTGRPSSGRAPAASPCAARSPAQRRAAACAASEALEGLDATAPLVLGRGPLVCPPTICALEQELQLGYEVKRSLDSHRTTAATCLFAGVLAGLSGCVGFEAPTDAPQPVTLEGDDTTLATRLMLRTGPEITGTLEARERAREQQRTGDCGQPSGYQRAHRRDRRG